MGYFSIFYRTKYTQRRLAGIKNVKNGEMQFYLVLSVKITQPVKVKHNQLQLAP